VQVHAVRAATAARDPGDRRWRLGRGPVRWPRPAAGPPRTSPPTWCL